MRRSILCLGLLWGTVTLGWAEIYRWKDAAGHIHFTDNLAAIPPAYRPQVRVSPSAGDAEATRETPTTPPDASLPPASGNTFGSPGTADADTTRSGSGEQRIRALEQQLVEARQQRQAYIDRIAAERRIRTSPEFGRQRREVAEVGRALATVERQIDSLQAALQKTREDLGVTPPPESAATDPSRSADNRQDPSGESAAAWQKRFRTARDRVRQAQEQRQSVLTRLSGEEQPPRAGFGRRGREVIQQTQELQRLEQEIRTAEAALRSLEAEAKRAGVSPE